MESDFGHSSEVVLPQACQVLQSAEDPFHSRSFPVDSPLLLNLDSTAIPYGRSEASMSHTDSISNPSRAV